MSTHLLIAEMSIPAWVALGVAAFCFLSFIRTVLRLNKADRDYFAGEWESPTLELARIAKSKMPGPILCRMLMPGKLETAVASRYIAFRKMDEAIAWIKRGLSKTRRFEAQITLNALATEIYLSSGRKEEANEHLQTAINILQNKTTGPTDGTQRVLECLRQQGRSREALAYCLERLNLADIDSRTFLLYALVEMGYASQLIEKYDPLEMALPPQFKYIPNMLSLMQEAHLCILMSAMDQLEPFQIEKLRGRIQAIREQSPITKAMREMCLSRLEALDGQADSSIALEQSLEALDHANPIWLSHFKVLWYGLARNFQILGDHEKALSILKFYTEAFPHDPITQYRINYRKIQSLEALGRFEEANDKKNLQEQFDFPEEVCLDDPSDKRNLDPLAEQAIAVLSNTIQTAPVPTPAPAPVSSPAQPPQSLEPHQSPSSLPQAVSSMGVWIWCIGLLSLVPFVGGFFGLSLIVLAMILLFRKKRFQHDRKTGTFALILGCISIGFMAFQYSGLVYHYVGGYEDFTQTTFEEDDEYLEASGINTSHPANTENFTEEDWKNYIAQLEQNAEKSEADNISTKIEETMNKEMPWQLVAVVVAIMVLSCAFHEFGHALSAYWSGDPTASNQGRLTLNPIKHLSLLGSFIVPCILALIPGGVVLGWAKGVPYKQENFRNWRAGTMAVSLAGISANLYLALLAMNCMSLIIAWFSITNPAFDPWSVIDSMKSYQANGILLSIMIWVILLNSFLLWLNMLPFPPLDGFVFVRSLLPRGFTTFAMKYQHFATILMLILLFSGALTIVFIPAVLIAMIIGSAGVFFGALWG